MGKLFGTDGIRGVVGETLTAEQAFRVGQAIASVLAEETGRQPVIMIGKDTRISSDMLESALMAGICSVGGDVKPLGTIPTPAVAYLTIREKADAGIVISASHNPFEYNGIKVFNGHGYKLPDATEARIEEKILSPEPMEVKSRGAIGRRHHGMRQLKQEYINFLASTVESDLSGLHILVDCANGAASTTAPELFGRFKAHTDFIHKDPDGTNINNRCGSTHLEDLGQSVVKGHYDIGVAFDGDADRCLLVDETGGAIDGDKVLAVCARDMKRRGKLNGNTIVATVMSNLGLHEFCRNSGIDLVCTNVGDRNVLEKMLANDFRIGGEQSGHTIFTELETTGDGEVTALQFLQVLQHSGMKASELAGCCSVYPQVLINVEVPHTGGVKETIMASRELSEAVNREEEALGGDGRVLVRASGTESLIRVMVEAKSSKTADEVAQRLVNFIKSLKIEG
ncbi:MAG: phosphoglucosamine mutase [Oscillibacter sp.]|jgi:phosphoglucosamine mutase|nr:phosphoglucosamine mutase [Oscillibacter sp.]